MSGEEEARRTFRRIRIRMQIKHFKCTTQTDSDECQRREEEGPGRGQRTEDSEVCVGERERQGRVRDSAAQVGSAIMEPLLTHLGQLPID